MRIKNSPYITALRFSPKESCQIASDRFVLQTATTEEIGESYVRWFNDDEVRAHLGLATGDYDLARVRAFAAGHNTETSFLFWVSPTEDTGNPIGFVQLFLTRIHALAQTSICLGDKDWWGKGAVGEARSAVLDFAFRKMGCEKVFGHCQKPNSAALFNYQAEGWDMDGVLRRHHKVGEERVDLIQYAMFRDEWMRRIDAWVAERDGVKGGDIEAGEDT